MEQVLSWSLALRGNQNFRLLIVGAATTLVSYVLFVALNAVCEWDYQTSLHCSFWASVAFAFCCHKVYTFPAQRGGIWARQLVLYIAKNAAMWWANDELLHLLVSDFTWRPWIAQGVLSVAIAAACVVLIPWIFVTRRN